jgi:hypothetical protein
LRFLQLFYLKLASDVDPMGAERYRRRSKEFANDFVHYFDSEGTFSVDPIFNHWLLKLSYFRASTPFRKVCILQIRNGMILESTAFADVELPTPLTWGVVKGIFLRNFRW